MDMFRRGGGGNTMAGGRSRGGNSKAHTQRVQFQATTMVLATSAAVATSMLWGANAVQRRCPAMCSAAGADQQHCHPGPGMCLNNSCCSASLAASRCRPGSSIVYGVVDLAPQERAMLMSPYCQLKQTVRVNQ